MLSNIALRRISRFCPSLSLVPIKRCLSSKPANITQIQLQKSDFDQDINDTLITHLDKRGLVASITHKELELAAETKKLGLYCGADPTASSLHLGNLLPLIILLHFNLKGHDVVGLVGGATGKVGDPSGRLTERSQMDQLERDSNVKKIQGQLAAFLEKGVEYAKSRNYPISEKGNGEIRVKDNYEWWESVTMVGFLANYGRFIRISSMLARDSIKGRLESSQGIGFNEFTYQILQAFDFWHLFKNENVHVQVGGNDQWGNITAGIDFISRLTKYENGVTREDGKEERQVAFGITVPLLTTSLGEKFGKSAGNAVFIDKCLTSPFQLFQYFIRTPDIDVEKLLKIFTLLPLSRIASIVQIHNQDPALRYAQRILSIEATDLIHGVGSGEKAALVSSILYPHPEQAYGDANSNTIIEAFKDSGILTTAAKNDFVGLKFGKVIAKLLQISDTEANRFVKNGAVYVGLNRERIDQSNSVLLASNHLIDGKLLLLRIGKQKYQVVELI